MQITKEDKIKHTNLVDAQALAKKLLGLMGKKAFEGTFKRCMRKIFD